MKTSSARGSACTTAEWSQLQETVIAFFSAWLRICGTRLTTRQSYFSGCSRVTVWWDSTLTTMPPTLPAFAVRFVSASCGAEACRSDFPPYSRIVVSSCLEPRLEQELDVLLRLITEHTRLACFHY